MILEHGEVIASFRLAWAVEHILGYHVLSSESLPQKTKNNNNNKSSYD